VSIDEQHIALPKLYGAPAYVRPAAPIATAPRPFDPDDLPLVVHQSEDEREFVSTITARAYAADGSLSTGSLSAGLDASGSSTGANHLQPRSLSLRAIAGRLIGSD
jgi:hypothetical protein